MPFNSGNLNPLKKSFHGLYSIQAQQSPIPLYPAIASKGY